MGARRLLVDKQFQNKTLILKYEILYHQGQPLPNQYNRPTGTNYFEINLKPTVNIKQF